MSTAMRYIPIVAVLLLFISACKTKDDPEDAATGSPIQDGLCGIEYRMDGEAPYELILKETPLQDYSFYAPAFSFVKGPGEDMVAAFSFNSSQFRFNLKSTMAYFINRRVYEFTDGDSIILGGTPLAEGRFEFRKDNAHKISDWHSTYSTFYILFEGTTADGRQVSGGRIWFMESMIQNTGASIYTYFVYAY